MTIFDLKLIACISMVLDHIKYAIPATSNVLTLYFGRLAFPLFAFIAVQGYLHTSNFKKYLFRLIIFGAISEIPFLLFVSIIPGGTWLNIMFTLFLGLLAIFCIDKLSNKFFGFVFAVLFAVLASVLKTDYGWYGVGLMVLIYVLRNHKVVFSFAYVLFTFIFYVVDYIGFSAGRFLYYLPYIICSSLPLIFMLAYNGKLGKKLKYFYYWFYPAHLLAFYLISFLQ